jgi:DNA-binding CsgD family transcriptional regulator
MSRQKLRSINRRRSIKAQETRAEVLARIEQPATQIAAELGITKQTVHRHIAAARQELIAANQDSISEWRKAQLDELNRMREILADNKITAGRRIELTLAIIREEMKLCGTAAESRAVIAHISPNADPLFLKFKKSIADLNDAQIETVFAYATNLRREPVITVRDASWFPQPEKPLLEGETKCD